jgi:hypothetical protein
MKSAGIEYPYLLGPETLRGPRIARAFGWLFGPKFEKVPDGLIREIDSAAEGVACQPVRAIPAEVLIQESLYTPFSGDPVAAVIATAQNVRAQVYATPEEVDITAQVNYARFLPSEAQNHWLSSLGVNVQPRDSRLTSPMPDRGVCATSEAGSARIFMRPGTRFVTNQALQAVAQNVEAGRMTIFGPRSVRPGMSLVVEGSVAYDPVLSIQDSTGLLVGQIPLEAPRHELTDHPNPIGVLAT